MVEVCVCVQEKMTDNYVIIIPFLFSHLAARTKGKANIESINLRRK